VCVYVLYPYIYLWGWKLGVVEYEATRFLRERISRVRVCVCVFVCLCVWDTETKTELYIYIYITCGAGG